MSKRDIVGKFEEIYDGAQISPMLVFKVTQAVIEHLNNGKHEKLEELYSIVHLDCIVVKVSQDGRVIKKAIYVALGVDMEGHEDVLGLWMSEN